MQSFTQASVIWIIPEPVAAADGSGGGGAAVVAVSLIAGSGGASITGCFSNFSLSPITTATFLAVDSSSGGGGGGAFASPVSRILATQRS